jgi:hypothetical protein
MYHLPAPVTIKWGLYCHQTCKDKPSRPQIANKLSKVCGVTALNGQANLEMIQDPEISREDASIKEAYCKKS